VTRRGRFSLPAGEQRVVLDQLPFVLQSDSVRVAGSGPATVFGVDVVKRHQPRTTDETAAEMEEQLRQARTELAAITDEDSVAEARLAFLSRLGQRSAGEYAKSLAAGGSDPGRVAELADALAAQQAAVYEARRALAERRERVQEQIAAYERGLEARRRQREPDRMAVEIELQVDADAEVELEVSYLVHDSGWYSSYDLRLDGEKLTLTWYGMVSQHTGEDWPETDLRLSTARPSGSVTVPELQPWFLDRIRPMAPVARTRGMPLAFGAARAGMEAAPAPMAAHDMDMDREVTQAVATIEQGATAATYTPARPVAVPADGAAHRATVAVVELDATLDYITAPVLAAEAHLRATVSNGSAHTLLPGRAAVFHGGDFVGSAELETWAPGEEVELALGVDDRVRVERELVRRTAGKTVLSTTRRREAEHKITVANHTPRPARVTVLDQIPVSRDEGIVVKELRAEPAPVERTDMGVLTWKMEVQPGETREIHLGVRVELSRGVDMGGWRE
jgi:uncharacterized protein (TIGR02231 family)